MYNISKRYHNESESRRRIIIAPNMERVRHQYSNYETYYKPPQKTYYCSQSNKELDEDHPEPKGNENTEESREDKIASYEEWLINRKKLINDLKNMSLNVEYLKRKKDLTETEKRVLKKLMSTDKETQTDPDKRKRTTRIKSSDKPKIVCPTPMVIERIEAVKVEKKWRLVDIFKDLDKNKDWRLHKEDFMRECRKGNLNVTDAMVDELLMAYGNYQKKLDYKMMAKGRTSLLNDQRRNLKESQSSFSFNDSSNQSKLTTPHELSFESTNLSFNMKQSKDKFQSELNIIHEIKSAEQKNRHLKVPSDINKLQPEKYPEMLDRSTSAHSVYSIRMASDAIQAQIKSDNIKVNEKVAEFRAKLKTEYENVIQSIERIDNDKLESVARAFSHPIELDRGLILRKLKLKEEKRRWDEKEAERERKEALRKAKTEKMYKY